MDVYNGAALLLLPFLFLCTSCDLNINDIIQDVGKMDNYYSSDLHRASHHRDDWKIAYANIMGNWTVVKEIDFGKGYRGPVVTEEEDELKEIFKSINGTSLSLQALHTNGRVCNISITGPQLLRNYIRYYRRKKEKMSTDSGLMTLGFKYNGTNVTLGILQEMDVDKVGMFKYLPYTIHDLRDVFGFTLSWGMMPSFFTKYEVTSNGDCLPHYHFPNDTGYNNHTLDESDEIRAVHKQLSHNCSKVLSNHAENLPCFDIVKDLEILPAQFFMLAISLQTALFKLYSRQGLNFHHQVCTLHSIDLGYTEDLNNRNYVLKRCCTQVKRHAPHYEGSDEKDQDWHCYDPYYLTHAVVRMFNAMSFGIVALFPLIIKWMPEKEKRTDEESRSCDANTKSAFGATLLQKIGGPSSEEGPTTDRNETHKDTVSHINWMFFDDDPGYHFSPKVILWYMLLFNKVNRGFVMFRRLFFLYIIATLAYLSALQLHIYYTDLYDQIWQFHFTTFLFIIFDVKGTGKLRSRSGFNWVFTLSIVIIPLSIAIMQFILLSPILVQRKSIAEILYWNERETAVGKYVSLKVQKHNLNVQCQSSEARLYKNLKTRMSYITYWKFWKFLLYESLYEVQTDGASCWRWLRLFVKVLLLPVMIPCYTCPVLTVFRVVFCGQGVHNIISRRRWKIFFVRLSVALGVICFTSVLLACITMYVHMVLFITIDIIRTLTNTLTHVIFLMSAIVNIKGMFSDVGNKYREIKLMIFEILQDMSNSPSEQEQKVSQCMLRTYRQNVIAIPKSLFVQVCKQHMPYGKEVAIAMFGLLLKLTFLVLLYMAIVDYQIFAQLTQTGEAIITVVFVSIPQLLSHSKSEAQKVLEMKYMSIEVRNTILDIFESGECCDVSPEVDNSPQTV